MQPSIVTLPKKARVSIVIDLEKKQALEQLAKSHDRTLNYFMGELVDKALQEAKEQREYNALVEQRVMQAYQSVLDGKKGKNLADSFASIREHCKNYANAQDKQ